MTHSLDLSQVNGGCNVAFEDDEGISPRSTSLGVSFAVDHDTEGEPPSPVHPGEVFVQVSFENSGDSADAPPEEPNQSPNNIHGSEDSSAEPEADTGDANKNPDSSLPATPSLGPSDPSQRARLSSISSHVALYDKNNSTLHLDRFSAATDSASFYTGKNLSLRRVKVYIFCFVYLTIFAWIVILSC